FILRLYSKFYFSAVSFMRNLTIFIISSFGKEFICSSSDLYVFIVFYFYFVNKAFIVIKLSLLNFFKSHLFIKFMCASICYQRINDYRFCFIIAKNLLKNLFHYFSPISFSEIFLLPNPY